jgi:hypothetical protein
MAAVMGPRMAIRSTVIQAAATTARNVGIGPDMVIPNMGMAAMMVITAEVTTATVITAAAITAAETTVAGMTAAGMTMTTATEIDPAPTWVCQCLRRARKCCDAKRALLAVNESQAMQGKQCRFE